MSYEKYCNVIDELCKELDIPDSQSMYALCGFEFADNFFSIIYPPDDPENLIVFCDYGEIPKEDGAIVLRRALETNMFLFDSKSPRLAINPETERVVLIAPIPLKEMTGEALLHLIGIHAANAKVWRETYFLEEPTTNDEISKETGDSVAVN